MKNKILLILLVLAFFVIPAQAAVYDYGVKSVGVGHGAYGLWDEPASELNFLYVSADGRKIGFIDGYAGGDTTPTIHAYNPDTSTTLANLESGVVLTSGEIVYTVTKDSIRYLIVKKSLAPTAMWFNGEAMTVDGSGNLISPQAGFSTGPSGNVVVIDSGVGITITEHAGKIYYTKGNDLYYASVGQWLSTFDRTLTGTGAISTFDVYDNDVYFITHETITSGGVSNSRRVHIYKNDELVTSGAATTQYTQVGWIYHHAYIKVFSPDIIYIDGYTFVRQGGEFTRSSTSVITGVYDHSFTKLSDFATYRPPNLATNSYYATNHMPYAHSYLAPVQASVWNRNTQINFINIEHTANKPGIPALPSSNLNLSASLTSIQSNYYNNTPLTVRTYVNWPLYLTNVPEGYPKFEDHTFVLYLYDPEGRIVGSYRLDNWQSKNSLAGFDLIRTYTFDKNVQFNPPVTNWQAGSYTFRLTEQSQQYGLRQVAQLTVTVDNVSGSVGPGGVAPGDVSGSDIWSSVHFKALMLILIPALGLGIVAGMPGALVGLVLGIFLAFAMGLLSLVWVILTIFAIVAAFGAYARDMITGGRV